MIDAKQVYRFKYGDAIIAERTYPWIDRILILWSSDRTVLIDMKFSEFPLQNWELITPSQGDSSEY